MEKTKTKILQCMLFAILAAVMLLSFAMTSGLSANNKSVSAYTTSGDKSVDSNAVTVAELWDDTGFNTTNMQTLMGMLAPFVGSESTLVTAGTPVTAEQIRYSTTNKAANKDIVVTLGGLDWMITYLSKDKRGNTIATMWLVNSNQLFGKTYYKATSYSTEECATFSELGACTWSSGWIDDSVPSSSTCPYPSNMYGTSFMRSQVLNNGGEYATGKTSLTNGKTQHADSVFAPFTMPLSAGGSNLYYYIVTPNDVAWQENGESAKTNAGSEYNRSNDNWGIVSDSGFVTSSYNYSNLNNNDYNSAWKNDKLWIPSLSETGKNTNGTNDGLWKVSNAGRSNDIGGNGSSVKNGGVTEWNYTWLRSGNTGGVSGYSKHIEPLKPSGDGSGNADVTTSCAVRPALHLNLSAIPMPEEHEANGIKYEYLDNSAKIVGYTNDIPSNITIPASIEVENVEYAVTEIKSGAFNGANLESVTFTSETPITMGTNVFGANSGVSIIVPNGAGSAYQSAWSAYSGQIEELPETGIELNLSILLVTLVLGGALIAVAFKRKEQL